MQERLYFEGYRRTIYIILTLIFLFIHFNLDSKGTNDESRLRLSGSMYAAIARRFFAYKY
jgi:hypothetical protein